LAVPVVAWAGWAFHRSAAVNLRHGAATMDTLVSLGTLAAYGWSLYALLFGGAGELGMVHEPELLGTSMSGRGSIYLEAATGVTTFLLAGRYLEARSKRAAGAALRALLDMGAKQASVLRGGVEVPVPIDQLQVGEEFVVRPGEKVAADGVVVAGESAVDMSLLTGEAVPVEVGVGDPVIGAAINEGGRLIVRANRVGADTQLAQLGRLVEQAQSGKAPVQRLADRISAVFVPVVVVLSLLTLAGWVLAGAGWAAAFTAAVAVLIIACPCALGLATPTALLVGSGRGAQLGLVIAGPEVLEQTRRIDTVILDKTGTVTTGSFEVRSVQAVDGWSSERVLRLAGSVQQGSEHPIGRAILQAAGTALPKVSDFRGHRGFGVSGQVEGLPVLVGHIRFLRQQGCDIPAALDAAREAAEAKGETAVLVAIDRVAVGLVTLADAVKDTSAEAIADLRRLGLHPVLLTGDNAAVARRVAGIVGVDEVHAEVLPADKVSVVRERQQQGHVVAMVGDGVNDAAALAQADLGIAMGAGSDVAIQAADLTVIGNDLRGVGDAIRLSRRTLATIKGNLVWAFG
jgi:P-type Cu+ transporter